MVGAAPGLTAREVWGKQSSGAAKGRKPRAEPQPHATLGQGFWREKPRGCIRSRSGPQCTPHHAQPHPCRAAPRAGAPRTAAWGAVSKAAASACCGALPLLARLARLFPPSAEPSTFIFMFPSLIRSTLPLQSNERAELKQTQSVREGPGKDVWGHCKGTCSTLMQNQDSFGSQHSLSPHPLPHTYPHGTPHHSRG